MLLLSPAAHPEAGCGLISFAQCAEEALSRNWLGASPFLFEDLTQVETKNSKPQDTRLAGIKCENVKRTISAAEADYEAQHTKTWAPT